MMKFALRSRFLASAMVLAATGCPALTLAHDLPPDLRANIQADYDEKLAALFTHFHANPELSFRETNTANRIASELTALGYDVTPDVGQTGVVAVMKNGDGPTVMIRADMDGLPVKEATGLPYASTAMQKNVAGKLFPVMHACGHDVHITSLIGTAKQMRDARDEWSGTLVLVAQPAEEIISGAKAMLDDGLYTRFPKPDYAIAFHVTSMAPTGMIALPQGLAYSSSDSVDITVRGVGTHGASPHMGVDPVLIASTLVVNLQSIVSRSIAPLSPGVITVGSIHGGTKHNIIGNQVDLQLTVRSDDPEVRAQLLDAIDRVAAGTAATFGVPEDLYPIVTRLPQSTPPTKNDPEMAGFLDGVLAEHFGRDVVVDPPRQGMGAEDFAEFVAPELGVKGVYMAIGGTLPQNMDTAAGHHSPLFKVEPEPSIVNGTEAMVVSALALFGR